MARRRVRTWTSWKGTHASALVGWNQTSPHGAKSVLGDKDGCMKGKMKRKQ